MIRTQISLSATEYRLAKAAAKSSGISLAELLRRALRLLLPVAKEKPWTHFIGSIASGNPRASQEIDDIVYGHKD